MSGLSMNCPQGTVSIPYCGIAGDGRKSFGTATGLVFNFCGIETSALSKTLRQHRPSRVHVGSRDGAGAPIL